MSSGVVELENAMRLLSGEQTGLGAPLGRSVMRRASPPASKRRASWGGLGLPLASFSPARRKAKRLPSGDQRGCASCLPLVSRMGDSPPEVATVQIEVSYPVRFSSTTTRVKATREPSGASWGLAIQTKSKRSFSVMGRLAVGAWAATEAAMARVMMAAAKRNFMRVLVNGLNRAVNRHCATRKGECQTG